MRIRRADPASSAPHDNCEGIPKETSTPCAPLPTAPLLVLQLLRLALGHLEDSLFQPKAVTNLQLLSFWQPAAGLCIFLYLPPLQAQFVFLYQLATNPLLHWDLLLKNSIVPPSDTIGYIACKKLLLWLWCSLSASVLLPPPHHPQAPHPCVHVSASCDDFCAHANSQFLTHKSR